MRGDGGLDKAILQNIEKVTGTPVAPLSDATQLVSDLGLSSIQVALLLSEVGDSLTANLFESAAFLQGKIKTVGDIKSAVRQVRGE